MPIGNRTRNAGVFIMIASNGLNRPRMNPTAYRAAVRVRNGSPTMLVGDRVRLVTPDNERLHGTTATVKELTEWGAHCDAPAAASGAFRATWDEMEALVTYTGECCTCCGSINLRWSGACKVCENCGTSGSCG